MKVSLLFLFLMLFTLNSYAQNNFEWIKTDSIKKTKEQIYSTTKMFIAETWKSSKDVIQNDDKDGGLILIKGLVEVRSVEGKAFLLFYDSWYSYNVTFRMKDKKYQIKIDNVSLENNLSQDAVTVPVMDYTLSTDDSLALVKISGGKMQIKRYPVYRKTMIELKSDLQSIIEAYSNYLKKSIVSTDF